MTQPEATKATNLLAQDFPAEDNAGSRLPDLSTPFEMIAQYIDFAIRIINISAKAVVWILAIHVVSFAILMYFFTPIVAAKLLLIEIMLLLGLLCSGIVYCQQKIMGGLAVAEEIAGLARDQAFVDLNIAREELSTIRKKLKREVDDQGRGAVNELLKTVSPLVMMFIQKEKNLFRWGMFGLKIAQNAMALMKQRSKNP